MKKYSRFFKRTQSWVLTLALLLSAVTPVWSLSVFAEDDNLTGSLAESTIIANNYDDLTDAEKALLKSGYLVGEVHQFKIPDDNDGLISVDTDNKKITASPYTGTTGYTWKPVSAQIVTGSVVEEDIALTNGEGTYTFDGNAFSVKVKYALEKEIPAATQELLLNAPAWLVDGLAKLDEVADASGAIDIIEATETVEINGQDCTVMDILVLLATTGIEVYIPMFGQNANMNLENDEADAAILALRDQMNQNAENGKGKVTDLSALITEYNTAASQTGFLINNGVAMKAKAIKMIGYMDTVLEDPYFVNISSNWLDGQEGVAALRMLKGYLEDIRDALVPICYDNFGEDDQAEKSWPALEKNLVKAGLTDDKLVKLDELVKAVSAPTGASQEIKNPLQLATTTVQHNMSMFDVTVNVVLKVTDPTTNELVTYETKTTKVTLAENATNLEIFAAINESGIRSNSVAEWKAEGKFVDGKFTSIENAIPDTLTQDFTFTTTYQPLTFNITFDYADTTIPYYYGSEISLPVHTVEGKVYDYTIDNNYYPQGSNYTVVDNMTITREEGKAYTSRNLYKIVADNYFAGNKTAADILNTGVLKGDTIVNVRYPDNNNNIVTLDGATLTANPYFSNYEGLSWEPYSYTVDDTTVVEFDHGNHGTQVVEIEKDNFGRVVVTYRLTLTNFADADILDIANIPNLLTEEAKAQQDALKQIADRENNLKLLSNSMLTILGAFIGDVTLSEDADEDEALKKSFTDAIDSIKANCVHTTTKFLKIYEIAVAYNAASDPLFYYYQNHEYIRNEIALLAECLGQMLGEEVVSLPENKSVNLSADDKLKGLENLLIAIANDPTVGPQAGITPEDVGGEDGYLSKITDLESIMVEVQNDLTPPNNALIDTASGDLPKLTALLRQGVIDGLNTLPAKLFLSDSSIFKDAEGKTSLSVTIQIEGEGEETLTSDTVFDTDVISSNLITGLKDKVATVLAQYGVDAKFYETSYDAAVLDALIGQVAGELAQTSFTFTWNYKDFTVSVPGTADQTVNIKNTVINLPASQDAAIRFDYYINGVKVSTSGTYNLSAAELEQVANGTFVVTMEQIDVEQESLVNYVNSLNDAMDTSTGVFALIENGGEYSIVFKINGTSPDALTNAMMGLAQGIVQGSYPYVGLGGEAFLDDGTIYLQSVLDALGNSGFGTESILAMMDANGNINHMTLPGTVVSNAPVNKLGGKFFGTTMELGLQAGDATSIPFYVTLDSASAELIQVRNALGGQIGQLMTFICEDGAININLNLPQKAYEAFLAALLVTEKIDLSNINDVDGAIAVGFVNDMLIPLFRGDITLETFENTLAMFGANVDLTSQKGAETIFNTVKDYYTNAVFTYDETSGTATGNVGIESLLASFDLGPLANIIAEKDTGLDISLGIGLENLGNDYDALYLDINASGITNKIGLTSDLAAKLDEIAGTSMIILFRDITADLTCKTTTIFNLNGHTVNGSLKGVGKTIVIDSNVEEAVHGTITNGVSGNVTLVDGKYNYNVTDYIKAGFIQDANGVVVNQYYDIVEDANGNVIISLNASMIRNREFPDITALALDMACDLLFNGYSSNYLALGGNTIYDITITDLVGLYGSSNRVDSVIDEVMTFVDDAQLNAFINTVLDDVMDFTALSEAVRNDQPIFDYTMVTKPWAVEFAHIKDGDYITSNIASGEISRDAKLQIVIVGEEADKTYVADLLAELGETVTSDVNMNLSHSKDHTDLFVGVTADANVFVDWTNPKYAVMFSVIIADGIGAPANADLVSGIREYYETGKISAL
ncbi:MAG: hypothetical protein E7486_00710, partial [Ruminococcaceae bacterium]|nr:hypothetical protein [Oscillospiraceae bacterium]